MFWKYVKHLHARRVADINWAHAAHVADIQAAHERELDAYRRLADVLAEQVEWLRFQLNARPQSGFVPQPVQFQHLELPDVPMGVNEPVMSETERELREMLDSGHIEQDELDAALQALGLADTETES